MCNIELFTRHNGSAVVKHIFLCILSLFGHQDVDLRGGCWTQVKHKGEDEGLLSQTVKGIDNELLRDTKVLRSPGPPSPTNSVISTTSSACDPLGRPLIYNRLPSAYKHFYNVLLVRFGRLEFCWLANFLFQTVLCIFVVNFLR